MISAAALLIAGLQPSFTTGLTLERIFSDPPLEGRPPMSVGLAPNGKYATFLKPNDADSEILDLWGVALPDGTPALLVATADLLGGKQEKLTEQEKMALERKRITKRGITSYLWCGKDARALVFSLSGDLYHAVVPTPGLKPKVTRLSNDDEPELNPVCSKDGTQVAYVKGGNVWVMDVATKKARVLTKGGGATKTFGLPEFIAGEEMGRHQGMWWSPDGQTLLVFEVDERAVGVKVRPQIFADRTELVSQRYPAAGEKNAAVTPWLVDVKTGKQTRLKAPAADGYLPRAGFFPDGKPWLQWQSRDQKRLQLFEGDAAGKLRLILEETDAAWVDLHDDLRGLEDGRRFVWSSERSGRRQIYVVDRATGAHVQLTTEPEPVLKVIGVDERAGLVFYAAARDRGRQQQIFSIRLTGGTPTLLTPEPGVHGGTFDDTGRFFVDTQAAFEDPPSTVVRDATGRVVFTFASDVPTELRTYGSLVPQWLDVTAEDGSVLNAVLFAPPNADRAQKAPVIAHVYGGPTGQTVTKSWTKTLLLARFWTQRGYGVFFVDGRGMGARDRAFARAHYGRFGDVEVKDLFAAVAQLKAKVAWVDPARIGVFGWSYGGFLASRAVLDEASPFAAAVAVAPVTDWSLYDTHYTERYIGMPTLNGKPNPTYTSSNLVARAKKLAKPLLLMHGTADDNVLFEHTLRLSEALQKEAKPFEMMIYPGKAHGIAGKQAQLHVYKTATAFFDRSLR